jgi:hypothetical protein
MTMRSGGRGVSQSVSPTERERITLHLHLPTRARSCMNINHRDLRLSEEEEEEVSRARSAVHRSLTPCCCCSISSSHSLRRGTATIKIGERVGLYKEFSQSANMSAASVPLLEFFSGLRIAFPSCFFVGATDSHDCRCLPPVTATRGRRGGRRTENSIRISRSTCRCVCSFRAWMNAVSYAAIIAGAA